MRRKSLADDVPTLSRPRAVRLTGLDFCLASRLFVISTFWRIRTAGCSLKATLAEPATRFVNFKPRLDLTRRRLNPDLTRPGQHLPVAASSLFRVWEYLPGLPHTRTWPVSPSSTFLAMPTHPRQMLAVAVVSGTPVVAACFVALRVAARRWAKMPLDLSDYCIILAAVLSLALAIPSCHLLYMWHYGMHVWQVPEREIEPDFDYYFNVRLAYNLLHTPVLPLVKASIILLLLKVGRVLVWVRRMLYVVQVINIGTAVGPWIALIFLCPPRTGNTWAPRVYGDLHCIGRNRAGFLALFQVTINMFTDVLIFPIPLILMRGLHKVNLRARLTIGFLFTASLGATGIGAVILWKQWDIQLYNKGFSDWTWNINWVLNHAGNNTAIIIACMPPLRIWILRYWSRSEDLEQQQAQNNIGQTTFAQQRVAGESLLYESRLEPVSHSTKDESECKVHDIGKDSPFTQSRTESESSRQDEKHTNDRI